MPKPLPPKTLHVHLTPEERAILFEITYTARGGFQDLVTRLQAGCDRMNTLHLSEIDLDRVIRYSTHHGGGGWQDRFRRIFTRTLGAEILAQIPKKKG